MQVLGTGHAEVRQQGLEEAHQVTCHVEAKHLVWQGWTDRLTGWVDTAGDWKGKKLPYTMGAVDVWMVLCLIDYFGVGQYVSTWNVIQIMMAWYSSE